MRALSAIIATAALLLPGCATVEPIQPEPVQVRYEFDEYGVIVPVVDGVPAPMSAEQRRAQVQLIVDTYCTP